MTKYFTSDTHFAHPFVAALRGKLLWEPFAHSLMSIISSFLVCGDPVL